MGSDRVEQKQLAREASDMLQCLTIRILQISPQSLGNGISETLDSNIFQVSMPWTPGKLVHIRRSTRALATSIRGAFENFEPGAPWYNITPLKQPQGHAVTWINPLQFIIMYRLLAVFNIYEFPNVMYCRI
jgi:hypothetical protein